MGLYLSPMPLTDFDKPRAYHDIRALLKRPYLSSPSSDVSSSASSPGVIASTAAPAAFTGNVITFAVVETTADVAPITAQPVNPKSKPTLIMTLKIHSWMVCTLQPSRTVRGRYFSGRSFPFINKTFSMSLCGMRRFFTFNLRV